MIRYVFRSDELLPIKAASKADPQKIGEALEKIAAAHDGRLDVDDVWKTARANPRNALHRHFEWNLEKAAEAHWRETSRLIIRCIRKDGEPTEDGTARAFLSIKDDGERTSYRRLADVKSSGQLREIVLKSALRDLEYFEKRYRELVDVCGEVAKAKRLVSAKLSKHENRASR